MLCKIHNSNGFRYADHENHGSQYLPTENHGFHRGHSDDMCQLVIDKDTLQ